MTSMQVPLQPTRLMTPIPIHHSRATTQSLIHLPHLFCLHLRRHPLSLLLSLAPGLCVRSAARIDIVQGIAPLRRLETIDETCPEGRVYCGLRGDGDIMTCVRVRTSTEHSI